MERNISIVTNTNIINTDNGNILVYSQDSPYFLASTWN